MHGFFAWIIAFLIYAFSVSSGLEVQLDRSESAYIDRHTGRRFLFRVEHVKELFGIVNLGAVHQAWLAPGRRFRPGLSSWLRP